MPVDGRGIYDVVSTSDDPAYRPADSGGMIVFSVELIADQRLKFDGRLDAAHVGEVTEILATVTESAIIDCENLSYISSAGLTSLINTQHRLQCAGFELTLINLNPHLRELFAMAGLDMIFRLD